MTSLKHSASRLLRALVMPLLVLSAILAPWVAAQFCIPSCKCPLTSGGQALCYWETGGAACLTTTGGGNVALVLTNTADGCCAAGNCSQSACRFDISITANADTGSSCCFYITSYDGTGSSSCLAGDCACVCQNPVPTLRYTATGVAFPCGFGLQYYVHVCFIGYGCTGLGTVTPDGTWKFQYACFDC